MPHGVHEQVNLNEVRACLAVHRHLFEEAYVYGSVARGAEDEHSDVDLVFALRKADILIYTGNERREILEGPGRYFMKDVFQKGIKVAGEQGRSTSVAAAG
jgi:predicted nucleotidyltransferase